MKVFYILWFFSPYNDIATMDHYDTRSECEAARSAIVEIYKDLYPRNLSDNGKNWVDTSIECIKVEVK